MATSVTTYSIEDENVQKLLDSFPENPESLTSEQLLNLYSDIERILAIEKKDLWDYMELDRLYDKLTLALLLRWCRANKTLGELYSENTRLREEINRLKE